MSIKQIKGLSALSDADYIKWKRKALQDGYLTTNTTYSQMSKLYQMQQLQNAGLNPNLSLDEANAILAESDFKELYNKGQFNQEIEPLKNLFDNNSQLASQLYTELRNSGYLTNTEKDSAKDKIKALDDDDSIRELVTHELGSDKKSLTDFDQSAFNYYYNQVKNERSRNKAHPEDPNQNIHEEASRRYLTAQNSNIFRDIKSKIDAYNNSVTDSKVPEIKQELSQMSPQDKVARLVDNSVVNLLDTEDDQGRPKDAFDILTDKIEYTQNTAYGDNKKMHWGSGWYREYKDTGIFDNFSDEEKNEIMAKYLAYKENIGQAEADQYLETAMQQYVFDHKGFWKSTADIVGGIGTTAGLIISQALVGIGGLAYEALGLVLPDKYGGLWAKNQASIMLTGRDLNGNEARIDSWSEANDPLTWLNQRLNMNYLNKVSQYKNWDIDEIRKADANYGISDDAMYVIDPSKGTTNFGQDAIDMLDMGGQAIGQIALAYLTSGSSLTANAAMNMGKLAAASRVAAEVATVTAPIASAYAINAANVTYDNAISTAREMALQQARDQQAKDIQTEDYLNKRKAAIDKYFSQPTRKGLDGTIYFAPFDSPEARKEQEQLYDEQYLANLAQEIYDSKLQETQQIAQNSSLFAFRTSATLEALKYGYTTAIFGGWKLSNNTNKLLEQNLGVKTYGNLTQDAAGKFTREGVHPLGIKALTLKTPRQIGVYKTAESAIVGGGFSNYTDDVVTGIATGMSLRDTNSSLLREFDPEAYADTWYGDSEAARALYIMGGGVQGAVDMIRSGQPWHSFYIGVGGSFFGAGFRFQGVKDEQGRGQRDIMREEYAVQNARYEKETGKKVSKGTKFRQKLNTYTSGIWATYEQARMGVNNLDSNIKLYNETLDKRKDVLNEIASLRQGLIERRQAENDMSFSNANLMSDNAAMKLIAIHHDLESNPLRKLDKQAIENGMMELDDIANDNVTPEKKEALIQSAWGAREQDKSKPVTEQRKAEIWEDIKANAKRFNDFATDYYDAVTQLKHDNKKLRDPELWPLLHQKAEIIAKSNRIQRDIDNLSSEISITVDTSVTDRTQGELTESARQSSIEAAKQAIERVKTEKQEAQAKIEELSKKETLTKDEQNELVKQRALILRADRAVPRLEAEIANLEEKTTMVNANTGLTTNVIQLHNMLTHPEMYTTEQQGQINRFKAKVGERGVLYIEEMAKMQDQLNEMKDAQEALEVSPETFQALVTYLQDVREEMGYKAMYNTRVRESFNFLKRLPKDQIGYNSAISLTSEQFDQFVKENPELSETLAPYKEINTSFNHIYSLTEEAKKNKAIDEATAKDILRTMQILTIQDSQYLLENGRQGVADMLQFIKSIETDPTKAAAIESLLTDFKRVASIQQSTTAYTEYKIRKLSEQSKEKADRLINQQKRAQEQQEKAEKEKAEAERKARESQKPQEKAPEPKKEEPETPKPEEKAPQEEPAKTPTEPAKSSDKKLPAGTKKNSEGNTQTMSADEQAEQLGIPNTPKDSLIDDSKSKPQETTEQQEEVHGCYFNLYDSQALNAGILEPMTNAPIYSWLEKEGIHLGNIIDDELSHILQVNSKIQLMKVKRDGDDVNIASNIFLVVEYTDDVAKHHLLENGGVITSNGKQYLIVGTMWNTKAQDGTEAANLMETTRDNLQRNGVNYFDSNPTERFYVDPVMNTEVTTFYSGHVIHTVNGESNVHSITELIDEYNRTHAEADHIDASNLGFGVITMKEGFYQVGPYSDRRVHFPQRRTADKYGQVYVLIPAANGQIVPIFINPILLSEMKEGQLKTKIDTQIIPQLLSEDYDVREQAIGDLCQRLCLFGSITNPEGKGVLIGTRDIPTVSLVNGKSTIVTFQLRDGRIYRDGQEVTPENFRQALYALNPRVNVNLSSLDTQTNLEDFLRLDEAGALTTDAAKLGTYGGKYYVAPINPANGQPIKVEQATKPIESTSDYSRAQGTPVMLPVRGQTYVLRNGKWVHQKDGSAVTDRAEQTQVEWAYKVQTGEATLAKRQGNYNYYTIGIETSKPVVVAYNISTRSYEGATPELANQIVAEKRAEIEKQRADQEAAKVIKEEPSVTESEAEPINRPNDVVVKEVRLEASQRSSEESIQKQIETVDIPSEILSYFNSSEYTGSVEAIQRKFGINYPTALKYKESFEAQKQAEVKTEPKKNDFELQQLGQQDRYSLDQILDSTDDAMMDYTLQFLEILDQKIAEGGKWKDFDRSNVISELQRLGIETNNISNIESWLDNLKNCE